MYFRKTYYITLILSYFYIKPLTNYISENIIHYKTFVLSFIWFTVSVTTTALTCLEDL